MTVSAELQGTGQLRRAHGSQIRTSVLCADTELLGGSGADYECRKAIRELLVVYITPETGAKVWHKVLQVYALLRRALIAVAGHLASRMLLVLVICGRMHWTDPRMKPYAQ